MVLGSHLGVPCGLDLKSQSLVIESFSVGSRAVLSTTGKGLVAAGSKSFMTLVSRVTKATCVEESIAGSGTRAELLEAAAQSAATGISTVLLWLADAICRCFLMLALLRPSRRTRKNRSRQQSAASGC